MSRSPSGCWRSRPTCHGRDHEEAGCDRRPRARPARVHVTHGLCRRRLRVRPTRDPAVDGAHDAARLDGASRDDGASADFDGPAATTHVDRPTTTHLDRPTTHVDRPTTTHSTVPAPPTSTVPAPPTSTVPPPTTSTVPPPPPTTTPPRTSTTRPPREPRWQPSSTPPAPPSDDDAIDREPPAPPAEAPSGRVVVPAGAVDGGELRPITFPVAGPVTYVNDYGACRDGCSRAHQGNDIIGDRLQPLVAMHDGVIDHLVDHPTAGYGIVIRDSEGWEYRVYHVNNDTPGTDDGRDDGTWRFAEDVVPGAAVRAGQLIGWMGDSGNSEGSVPHAHVEIHRPGGDAVNPYWSLRRAQRDVNCGIDSAGPAPSTSFDATTSAARWATTPLPDGWMPLGLSGGQPSSDVVRARMWVAPLGYTPVDAAALSVGDARYDQPLDCTVVDDVAESVPAELATILAAIRTLESGGDYTAAASASTASGAYQFLDSTWDGYGGYARALDAPPPVQDAKAAEWARAILARNGGDVASVPVSWYIGHVPVGDEWDRLPPYPGNTLTPREYQQRWMSTYSELLGRPWVADMDSWTPVDTSMTCHTVVVDVGTPGAPRFVLTQANRFMPTRPGGRCRPPTTRAIPPGRRHRRPPASSRRPARVTERFDSAGRVRRWRWCHGRHRPSSGRSRGHRSGDRGRSRRRGRRWRPRRGARRGRGCRAAGCGVGPRRADRPASSRARFSTPTIRSSPRPVARWLARLASMPNDESAKLAVSTPAPPEMRSSPGPPRSTSFPPLPAKLSSSRPPKIESAPAPPFIRSTPAPPCSTSRPPPPSSRLARGFAEEHISRGSSRSGPRCPRTCPCRGPSL